MKIIMHLMFHISLDPLYSHSNEVLSTDTLWAFINVTALCPGSQESVQHEQIIQCQFVCLSNAVLVSV